MSESKEKNNRLRAKKSTNDTYEAPSTSSSSLPDHNPKNTGTGKTTLLDDPDYLGLPLVPTEQRLTEMNNKKEKA